MTTALRPMSTGEVLDRTFFLYRNHFVLFFGIATLPPAMMLVLQLAVLALSGSPRSAVPVQSVNPALIAGAVVGGLFAAVVYLIGLALAQGATIFAVSAVHLGRNMTIGEAYSRVRGRFGRVIAIMILVALLVGVVGGGLVIVASMTFALVPLLGAAMGIGGYILGGLIALAAIVAAVLTAIGIFVRYSLAVPAAVLEDLKVGAAMKRSVFLAKGSRARIVAIYFLVTVLNWVVSWAVLLPLAFLGMQAKGSSAIAYAITQNGVGAVVAALLGPIITIAISLVYYDERVRKEAFDIQLMMAALDGPQPAAASSAPAGSIG